MDDNHTRAHEMFEVGASATHRLHDAPGGKEAERRLSWPEAFALASVLGFIGFVIEKVF